MEYYFKHRISVIPPEPIGPLRPHTQKVCMCKANQIVLDEIFESNIKSGYNNKILIYQLPTVR